MNGRIITLLLVLMLVVGSAVAVAYTRNESRQLFRQLEAGARARDAANEEWTRLQLEQAWLADVSRVEQVALDELGMQLPENPQLLVIEP